MPENMVTKAYLRKEMRRLRDNMPKEVREEKSACIADHLLSQSWYNDSKCLLVYSAIYSEVSLEAFLKRAWSDGKKLYFPRVAGDEMEFYLVSAPGELKPGSFGVAEPAADAGHQWRKGYAPILVPGVAFSRGGTRVGYGKGYYDRYLHTHPGLFPVGVCFELQITENLEAEKYDFPIRCLVTEEGCFDI